MCSQDGRWILWFAFRIYWKDWRACCRAGTWVIAAADGTTMIYNLVFIFKNFWFNSLWFINLFRKMHRRYGYDHSSAISSMGACKCLLKSARLRSKCALIPSTYINFNKRYDRKLTLVRMSPRLASASQTKQRTRLKMGLATYRAWSCWINIACILLSLNA